MEINIKPNETIYQVREEMVQRICDAFTSQHWSQWEATFTIASKRGTLNNLSVTNAVMFVDDKNRNIFFEEPEGGDRFNSMEMREAFRQLIKAGYFMFRYTDDEGTHYVCSQYPNITFRDAAPCYCFTEFFDHDN